MEEKLKKILSKNIDFNIFFLLSATYILKLWFEHFFLNYKLTGDNTGTFFYFQYYYNYFNDFGYFPLWTPYLDGGHPSILPLHYEGGSIIFFFLIFFNFLNNPYLAYLVYTSVVFLLILYVIYKIISLFNLRYWREAFICLSFINIFSIDFNWYFIEQFCALGFLGAIYYITKFFLRGLKFVELIKCALFSILFIFSFTHYLNILFVFYFPLFYFLICLAYKILFQKNLKNIKFKKKYLIYIIFLFIVFFTVYKLLLYELEFYYILGPYRDPDAMNIPFDGWLKSSTQNISFVIKSFLYGTYHWDRIPLQYAILGPIFIIYYFCNFNKFSLEVSENVRGSFLSISILSIIILYISLGHNFYFYENYFSKIFYEFPMIDKVRKLNFSLYAFRYSLFLIMIFYIVFFLNTIKSNKKLIIFISLVLILYTEFLLTANMNFVNKRSYIAFILIFSLFLLFIYYVKKSKKNNLQFSFTLMTLICCLIYYSINLVYIPKNNFENEYSYKNNINYKIEHCLSVEDIGKVYPNLTSDIWIWGQQLFLNTNFKPCNLVKALRIRGGEKFYHGEWQDYLKVNPEYKSIYKFGSNLDDNIKFNHVISIKNKDYKVSSIFSDDDKVLFESINNEKYLIKKNRNQNKILTKITYSPNWEYYDDDKNKLLTENLNGFILLSDNNGNDKTYLIYKNTYLMIYTYFIIFLGFFIIIFYSIVFYRNIKK